MTETIPTSTVTFLFTDIEGSTRLWEKYPESMKPVLARHDAILRQAVEANLGRGGSASRGYQCAHAE